MRLRETTGDSCDSERLMETHETQRDQLGFMRLTGTHETRETHRDQLGHMRLREANGDT